MEVSDLLELEKEKKDQCHRPFQSYLISIPDKSHINPRYSTTLPIQIIQYSTSYSLLYYCSRHSTQYTRPVDIPYFSQSDNQFQVIHLLPFTIICKRIQLFIMFSQVRSFNPKPCRLCNGLFCLPLPLNSTTGSVGLVIINLKPCAQGLHTALLENLLDCCSPSFHYHQIHSAFLDNILDTSIQVPNYLHAIILMLAQHCSARL